MISGYGLTEGGTPASTSLDDHPETIATTVGRARPTFELGLVDNDGNDVARVSQGRSSSGAPASCSSTSTTPRPPLRSLSPDGWLKSGDVGQFTESGCLKIVGRVKDMFIVGGFNWSRERMANYMVPRLVEFVDELPLNAIGKVVKAVLRERAATGGS